MSQDITSTTIAQNGGSSSHQTHTEKTSTSKSTSKNTVDIALGSGESE